jgi:hypothetical protein
MLLGVQGGSVRCRGMTATSSIVIAAVTGGIGLVAGVVGTAYKSRKALEHEYDIDLRKARVRVYQQLWSELEVLAKYSPPSFDQRAIVDLSVALRHWYFQSGGMYLSRPARNAYFDLQEALVQALDLDDPKPLREFLRTRGSRLRTAMTQDIATRVPPRLGGGGRDVDIPDQQRYDETRGEIQGVLASPSGNPS